MSYLSQAQRAPDFIEAVRQLLQIANLPGMASDYLPNFKQTKAVTEYAKHQYDRELEIASAAVVRWFNDGVTPSFDLLLVLEDKAGFAATTIPQPVTTSDDELDDLD